MSGGGEPPALVMLHAFGSAGRAYAPLADRLAGTVRVIAPDLPGFGGTPGLAAPSVAAYADWVEREVARAGLSRARLGGWSMGGKVALALAARRPAWLSGLVLVAPSPPSPEPMDEGGRMTQLAGFGDAALARRSVRDLVVASTPPAWIEEAVQDRLATERGAWRWWLEAGSREDLDLAGAIETPTLLAVGGDDPNLGEDVQRRDVLPRLGQAEFAVFGDCGHFVPLERPDALAQRVRAWTVPAERPPATAPRDP